MPIGARPSATAKPNNLSALTELLSTLSTVKVAGSPSTPYRSVTDPSSENPAVARCKKAYADALQAAEEKGADLFSSRRLAKRAFREAMPALAGRKNTRDFVACVAQGMLGEVFEDNHATRLLYAAQVAHITSNALTRKRPKSSKNNNLNAENTPREGTLPPG